MESNLTRVMIDCKKNTDSWLSALLRKEEKPSFHQRLPDKKKTRTVKYSAYIKLKQTEWLSNVINLITENSYLLVF